jgi:TolB protein
MRCRTHLALGLALFAAGLAGSSRGERVPVVVTPGSEQSYRIALQTFADASSVPDPARAAAFRDAIRAALSFSGIFSPVDEAAFLGPTTSSLEGGPPVVCSDWTQISADALLEGRVERDFANFTVAFTLWDASRCKALVRRRYSQPAATDPAGVARRIADDIVEAFIGLRGVSGTEIAFVSDRGGNKEIFVMNADGTNARAATANRSINNFPDWSPDGDAILYTSYRLMNRPFLFLSSRGRGRPGLVLQGLGDSHSQYRGVFAPEGSRLAIVMSDGGASDIYTVRADGRRLRRLTNSRSIEVSPAWSPDGEQLAFVSDRTGSPQIYVMNADGERARRLTFDGGYNTHPAWSPDGRWIAYETRVNGQFDIWLTDPEGTVNIPLITHPRSDESPAWSPNSRKLVFSSTRRGRADLYVVDRDGSNLLRLTAGAGNNTSPSWGPFPR